MTAPSQRPAPWSWLRAILTVVAIVALVGLTREPAAESVPPPRPASMGELAAALQPAEDGIWRAEVDGAGFVIENRRDDEAVRYFNAGVREDIRFARHEVAITLAPGFPDDAAPSNAAGLLFAFAPGKRFYYALTIGPRRLVTFWRRDERGLRIVANVTSPAVREAEANELRLVGRGAGVEAFVNGISIGTFGGEALATGRAGIIAIGRGRHRFSDYVALRVFE